MTIQSRIRLSLSGLFILLCVVALAGFIGSRVVASLANYYSGSLIPAIQVYNDMRVAAKELQVAVYSGDQASVDRYEAQARNTAERLAAATSQGPFQEDQRVVGPINEIVSRLERLRTLVVAHPPGEEVTPELEQAIDAWDAYKPNADAVIEHIITTVDGQIQSVQSTVLNVIAAIAAVSLIVFLGVAWSLGGVLRRGMSNLLSSFAAVAQGDLSVRAQADAKDEFGELARHFNHLAQSLTDTLGQVSQLVTELHNMSGEFNAASRNYAERSQAQSEETQQVATAMTEMSATIREVAQNAEETSHRAQDANQHAGHSRQDIEQAIGSARAMQGQMSTLSDNILELKDQSDAISTVVKTINDIAEQTNLLALNAAIEAARAGEQGRGFAVVADEVRNLSVKTSQSTQEIESVIRSLQTRSDAAASSARDSVEVVRSNGETIVAIGEGLQHILDSVSAISSMNELIATTSEEQSKVAEDMNTNVVRISDLSEANASETQHLVAGIQRIDEMAQQLSELIRRYRL
ncbi:methyl-accepting chemotaxis protein [Saccharospirillum alexandrii]|uniref:methyl-accepting chemotaxis protein n=1 Tax=Saccharospirillum alexandrii TaxID=2448477 RepID=UPI0037362E05